MHYRTFGRTRWQVSETGYGVRKLNYTEINMATSDVAGLLPDLIQRLRAHRWERTLTSWSQ